MSSQPDSRESKHRGELGLSCVHFFPMVRDKQWQIFSDIMKVIPEAKRKLTSEKGDEYLTRLASAVSDAPRMHLQDSELIKPCYRLMKAFQLDDPTTLMGLRKQLPTG